MSQEAIAAQLKKNVQAQLQRDLDCLRCTLCTEMHGEKWRIHGFGSMLKDGAPELVTIVIEYDKLEDLLNALPVVAASFYNVKKPDNLCPKQPPQPPPQ